MAVHAIGRAQERPRTEFIYLRLILGTAKNRPRERGETAFQNHILVLKWSEFNKKNPKATTQQQHMTKGERPHRMSVNTQEARQTPSPDLRDPRADTNNPNFESQGKGKNSGRREREANCHIPRIIISHFSSTLWRPGERADTVKALKEKNLTEPYSQQNRPSKVRNFKIPR